jgi:hypothetical protein
MSDIDKAIQLLEKELDNMADSAPRTSLERLEEIISELQEISDSW